MSDDASTTETTDAGDLSTATEGTVDLTAEVEKWKTLSKKNEARAKENAAAAQRLAQLEEAGKTEAEKAADRIAKAEAEVAAVPTRIAEALRESLVALGVVNEDDKVLLTATDPETLLAQVKRLADRASDRKKNGNRDPFAGRTPSSAASTDEREFVNALFGTAE